MAEAHPDARPDPDQGRPDHGQRPQPGAVRAQPAAAPPDPVPARAEVVVGPSPRPVEPALRVPPADGPGAMRATSPVATGGSPDGAPPPAAFPGQPDDAGRPTCTVAQLRRFIKSRPWIPLHELRRRFGIFGGDDDVTPIRVGEHTLFIGLPAAEGRLMAELLSGGDVGYELSLDPGAPIVVGVYPMRPVPRG